MTETSVLIERVQALPAEIFNKIFDLTFTPDSTIYVDKDYKPPAILQVSRATREKVMKHFFADDRIFYVSRPALPMWLQSIRIHTDQWHDGYIRSQLKIHSEFKGEWKGFSINCEIRVTKLLFKTNRRSVGQLLNSFERAWDYIIGFETPDTGIKKGREFKARAAGRRWWCDADGWWRHTDAVRDGLKFEVEYGPLGKRAWVGACDIEADRDNIAALRRGGRVCATEWCESKFGK